MTGINKDSDIDHAPNQTVEVKRNDALDGGWGWFVVLAAFVINIITDGCSYSFGVLFTNLIEYFHTSRSKTAWIGSIFSAVPLLCGPLASIISNKLGYRKASIVGGCITTVGFTLSYFVNSVEMLCITYGVVAGLGISLPYLNSIVAVSEYFEAKRSLATGLSECGAGIGTLIFAPLLEVLIAEYGWRGAVLIMGGIASNIIVCGALFRPLYLNYIPQKRTGSPKTQVSDPENKAEPLLISECNLSSNSFVRNTQNESLLNGSINACSNLDRENSRTEAIDLQAYYRSEDINSDFRSVSNVGNTTSLRSRCSSSCHSTEYAPLRCSTVLGGSIASLPRVMRLSKSCPDILQIKDKNTKCSNTLIDISVLKNRTFSLFIFSNFILYFWYDIPYVFTVDRAKMLGTTEKDASLIVAVIGVLHTIGNVLFGYLGDRKWISREILYCVSLIMCGATLICIPFFVTYIPSAVLAGLFGLFSAAAEALCSVIIVDILGIERLTNAFGIMMFLQGTANLFGPPFAGWLFDLSGRYRNTFCTAGVSISSACVIYLAIPVWRICKKSKIITNLF